MEASSPAALAGLIAHDDFIVGADQVLQDVSFVLLFCLFYVNGYFKKTLAFINQI